MSWIEIDGVVQTDHRRFTIRWSGGEVGEEMVLYMDGKRVTKPWHIIIDKRCAADKVGASANTH